MKLTVKFLSAHLNPELLESDPILLFSIHQMHLCTSEQSNNNLTDGFLRIPHTRKCDLGK